MNNYGIPDNKKIRVIIDTDAKNEVDDQFAIVHALLSESFNLKGIIAAHFGDKKSPTSMMDSYDEIQHLLKLMDITAPCPILKGAEKALTADLSPQVSEGARLIVEEGMKDEGTLYIAFLGAITNMASALLMEPKLAERDIKVIWIGGGNYPEGRWEYNLGNDITAANVVFRSGIEIWQIPRDVYRMLPVSFAELRSRVTPCGDIGNYLAESVIEFNNVALARLIEYRVLGDSPAIGVMLYEDCGSWKNTKRPTFNDDMTYNYDENLGELRVYTNMSSRFILEDFYAKLQQFHDENKSKNI